MSLKPSWQKKDEVDDLALNELRPGESPYFAMYRLGKRGIPIEKIAERCRILGIPIREKDIENWKNGTFLNQMATTAHEICQTGSHRIADRRDRLDDMKLSEFPRFPIGWTGTECRYFPCTSDNKPMQKWGWSRDYVPQLMTKVSAKVLSPCGWVGQNLIYQKFIVLDIDGRGHGTDDEQVIEFGSKYKNMTMCLEDPKKPGSFHLYFSTDNILPIRHFPWAKLDFMGNAANAAVYLKSKVSNGLPMAQLTEDIYRDVINYQKGRK